MNKYLSKELLLVIIVIVVAFYLPILITGKSIITGEKTDNVVLMLSSLGDNRLSGRFFPYFDITSNCHAWGDGFWMSPLHAQRLLSICMGAGHIGWIIIIIAMHLLLFLFIYYYLIKVFGCSQFSAIIGATAGFFHLSWSKYTVSSMYTAATILLVVIIFEYWLYIKTSEKKHLIVCLVSNALLPYMVMANNIVPVQLYVTAFVILISLSKEKNRFSAIKPLVFYIWPISVIAWIPIIAPDIFVIFFGLVSRAKAPNVLEWGINFSTFSQFIGILMPGYEFFYPVLVRCGLTKYVSNPDSYLFGSFLFFSSLLIIRKSEKKDRQTFYKFVMFYLLSVFLARLIVVPSDFIDSMGFYREFAFPAISGIVVALGIEYWRSVRVLPEFKFVYRFYLLLFSFFIIFILVLIIADERIYDLAIQFNSRYTRVLISPYVIKFIVYLFGLSMALLAYLFLYTDLYFKLGNKFRLWLCVFLIAVPCITYGYVEGRYKKSFELEVALDVPPEISFLQEKCKNHEFRVGIFAKSDLIYMENGQTSEFLNRRKEKEDKFLSFMKKLTNQSRSGLSFAFPNLHFFSDYLIKIRDQTNTNVIHSGMPLGELLDDYGVRYWLSDCALDNLCPGKFIKIYSGKYSSVYEKKNAFPVAYYVGSPTTPLPLVQELYGFSILTKNKKIGRISVHMDLRNMNIKALHENGAKSQLAFEKVNDRWIIDVPENIVEVSIKAREFIVYVVISVISFISFVVILVYIKRTKLLYEGLNGRKTNC